jgi:formamidopyrimidine-DNA glycosylase
MPELPEVEVTRRALSPHASGKRISAVLLGKPLRWPLGIDPSALLGLDLLQVHRRGKYLILQTQAGVLLIHLGMSGSLAVVERDDARLGLHEHFGLQLGSEWVILRDPRRFGAVVWSASVHGQPAATLLGSIGAEPLDAAHTPQWFWKELRQRRTPIKLLLLAGKVVCGVGNIYASEALFWAGIRPTRRSDRITQSEADKLLAAIRQVLTAAIDAGGSSLRDFKSAHGELGQFQTLMSVYGREGQACFRCGSTVRGIRQGQRSTFYCPGCQPR